MIRFGVEVSRAMASAARTARSFPTISAPSFFSRSPPSRLLHDQINGSPANPVALQMINYALSLARSQKSDESYAQGMLVLEQCLSTQSNENSSGMVLLAMSTLLSERGNIGEAIEKLKIIQDFSSSSLGVRAAAMEALVGLHLELGEDDSSSVFADRCLDLLEKYQPADDTGGSEVIYARAKAVKGLVELVNGNLESVESFFQGSEVDKGHTGSIALSYGEFLHATQKFQQAKELYQKIIQGLSEDKDFSDPHALAACNMSSKEVHLAATCALGQLEAHLGNFGDAEQILTRALTETEEQFGSRHPNVGVVLTCIALMFRRKAIKEHSSSLLIQEGLYRKALELLKAPTLETEEANVDRKDIVALAKGGYAEALCIQQNRKAEGEKMKRWAEAAWRNRRLSLAEALEIVESATKVPVIDTRISRAL